MNSHNITQSFFQANAGLGDQNSRIIVRPWCILYESFGVAITPYLLFKNKLRTCDLFVQIMVPIAKIVIKQKT